MGTHKNRPGHQTAVLITISRHLMAILLFGLAAMHLLWPDRYLLLLPVGLPGKLLVVYVTGLLYLVLGALLSQERYEAVARLTIGVTLLGLCLVNIPRLIEDFSGSDKQTLIGILRISSQIIFIAAIWTMLQNRSKDKN